VRTPLGINEARWEGKKIKKVPDANVLREKERFGMLKIANS
jgi:hypothetical protein